MEETMPNRSTLADWGAALRSPLAFGLSALLALQLGAALVLAWRTSGSLAPAATDRPLLTFDGKAVEVVHIDGKTDTGTSAVDLTRTAQGWVLKGLGDFPADGAKVEALLSQLSQLKRPLPVATTQEAQKRHRVADDNYERRVVLESRGKPVATLLLGESPGFRRQLARAAGESEVYDLNLATYDVGNRADDWLAKDRLRLDPEAVEGIATKDWELVKGKDGWRFAQSGTVTDKAPDPAAVVNLLGRLGNLSYRGVLGTQDKPSYKQSEPTMELRIKLKNGDRRTYRISKPSEGQDYVLKASDLPWYFTLADFDLEGILDRDKARLSGEAPKPSADARPATAPPPADVTASGKPQAEWSGPVSAEPERAAGSGTAPDSPGASAGTK